ncbi:MAG: hypothetical protein ACREIQ_02925, partial [Nitrospiria bacterium]
PGMLHLFAMVWQGGGLRVADVTFCYILNRQGPPRRNTSTGNQKRKHFSSEETRREEESPPRPQGPMRMELQMNTDAPLYLPPGGGGDRRGGSNKEFCRAKAPSREAEHFSSEVTRRAGWRIAGAQNIAIARGLYG